MEVRTCKTCGVVKPLTEFYKSGDGYWRWDCRVCTKDIRSGKAREIKMAGDPIVSDGMSLWNRKEIRRQ